MLDQGVGRGEQNEKKARESGIYIYSTYFNPVLRQIIYNKTESMQQQCKRAWRI